MFLKVLCFGCIFREITFWGPENETVVLFR
jgi:hypothetical protein